MEKRLFFLGFVIVLVFVVLLSGCYYFEESQEEEEHEQERILPEGVFATVGDEVITEEKFYAVYPERVKENLTQMRNDFLVFRLRWLVNAKAQEILFEEAGITVTEQEIKEESDRFVELDNSNYNRNMTTEEYKDYYNPDLDYFSYIRIGSNKYILQKYSDTFDEEKARAAFEIVKDQKYPGKEYEDVEEELREYIILETNKLKYFASINQKKNELGVKIDAPFVDQSMIGLFLQD
jgi:hypothetical protein